MRERETGAYARAREWMYQISNPQHADTPQHVHSERPHEYTRLGQPSTRDKPAHSECTVIPIANVLRHTQRMHYDKHSKCAETHPTQIARVLSAAERRETGDTCEQCWVRSEERERMALRDVLKGKRKRERECESGKEEKASYRTLETRVRMRM